MFIRKLIKKHLHFGYLKPSFIIIGAQKAGTTALYRYLQQHKSILGSNPKEIHYFDTYGNLNYKNYHKHFPKRNIFPKLTFEATPRYLYFPGTAKKLYDYNPNLKLIVSLRDPISRAYSAWNMYQQMKYNDSLMKRFELNAKQQHNHKLFDYLTDPNIITFRDWVKKEIYDNKKQDIIEPSILKRGYYEEQILDFFKYFPEYQLHFVNADFLKKDTEKELLKICKFLKIKPFDFNKVNINPYHKRDYKAQISELDKGFLEDYYSDKNVNLEAITKIKFDWL